jgi:hypothetical protein
MNQENKNKTPNLKDVKFVGVTFDPDSFKKGEDELNKAIEMGYKVITDYPTSTGVVFSVGLYDTQEETI